MTILEQVLPLFDADGDLHMVSFAHGLAIGGANPLRHPQMMLDRDQASTLLLALGFSGRMRRRPMAVRQCVLPNGNVIRLLQLPLGHKGRTFRIQCRLMRRGSTGRPLNF